MEQDALVLKHDFPKHVLCSHCSKGSQGFWLIISSIYFYWSSSSWAYGHRVEPPCSFWWSGYSHVWAPWAAHLCHLLDPLARSIKFDSTSSSLGCLVFIFFFSTVCWSGLYLLHFIFFCIQNHAFVWCIIFILLSLFYFMFPFVHTLPFCDKKKMISLNKNLW